MPRRVLLALAVVALLLHGGCSRGEPRCESRGAARRPNVLLVSVDTLRADHLGAYGYEQPTSPFIDALARRGVCFEQASSQSSWTLPAHMSLLTGRLPHVHGVQDSNERLPPEVPTLAMTLHRAGYERVHTRCGDGYRGWPEHAPFRAVLVTAAPETFAVLAGVIAELDRLPPRVSVEVMVFEITRPRGSRFGVNYFLPLTNPTGFDDLLVTTNSVGGGRVSEPSGDSVTFGRYVRRPLIPIVGPDGTVTVIPLEASDVSFEAGARIAETSILLRPNIIGVSGEEHEVFAGNNVPIPVASTPAAPTEGEVAIQDPLALSQNVERADIGTRLRLRPVVGQRGVVQLELELEVSDLVDSAVGSVEEVGPTFADRNLQAKISLAPGQRAMVGSLGAQVTTYSRTGIPFLMSIPGLGWLFSTVERRYDETDLVAVVEARVIHGSDEAAAESIRRRLAFERSVSRVADLTGVGEDPFAVLLETARSETDARVIADAFAADGFETRITPWDAWGQPVWDVYLTGMRSFEEAGRLARRLADAGWTPEITVLSPVNELAGD